ncbi:hypothetical protein SY83_05600 [Paenibacillus swuensis]|uniref:Uncharacterized protein n=1 Tax=Paenibacillus swuensis TaxID=1178515 RepID=A0A172TG07_9BACL|nr:Imm41 family immunity protein [Paenibacillus swuensis]ANE45866.1 hypothetical protein SY83_05600 [Paenibacillus swuensis]
MKEYFQILNNNYEIKEGSFIYSLSEEAVFNEQHFWDYYNAVIEVVKENLNKQLDKEVTNIIHWTYRRIMDCFLWHLDTNDAYLMDNFPSDNFIYFKERLDLMIEGYFGDFVMNEKQFGDSIKNPNYPELYPQVKD